MKDHLRRLGGMVHFLRPAAINTPSEFNAHLDMTCAAFQTLRMDEEPETREVDVSQTSDRMQRGKKSTRKKKATEPELELENEPEAGSD